VVGVDRSPEALARARIRAEQRGLAQVEFLKATSTTRRQAAEVLRRQATVLRAGGLVVPIEIDFTTARALPASPLVNQAVAWLTETFAKSGIPAIGPRLWPLSRKPGCDRSE
jgi:hypothetical protein